MDKSGTKSEFFATLKARGRVDPVDLTSTSNICIAIGYFSVGISQAFSITPLNIYLVHVLRAEPAMQNTVGILQALPWSLKIVIGFLSDAVPLFGTSSSSGCMSILLVACFMWSGVSDSSELLYLVM